MKFKIENGSGHISIELSSIGEYFRFDDPLVVTLPYSGGTIGRYFCALPYSFVYRNELSEKITGNLNNDFNGKVDELYNLLRPLFLLFKNGDYSLEYYRNTENEFFRYKTSTDAFAAWHYTPLQLAFGDEVDIKQIEVVKQRYKDFLKENELTQKYATTDIFEFTTNWIYDGSDEFYATQPHSIINQERVSYFEKKIAEGERPLVIIFNAKIASNDYMSSNYVLDGHHKLLAYQKLTIFPPLAAITYFPDVAVLTKDFDIENLATILYPWQVKHMLNNWDDKDIYILEKLKNPDSPLHKFIKNGLVKEYHDNKQLKHEAFYINDRVDGKSLEWYENGQLKHEHYYNKGSRAGTWKDYYRSGQLQYIQPFNDEGRYDGKLISYYENGIKRWLTKMNNGWNVDGYSHQSWFESGLKEAELKYDNGRIVERKNWDSSGWLRNHELYDAEQKKMVKQPLPVHSSKATPKKIQPIINGEIDLGIIRERQYPETDHISIMRIVLLILLMLITLLRLCR